MTLTDGMIQNGDKEIVLNWMKEGGLPYTDIAIKMRELDNDYFIRNVILYKNIFDLNGNAVGTIPMDLDANESSGTQKFYSYIGIMQDKFKLGGLYVADEIDSNFHPSLLVKLIRIFNNPNINKAGAQLLFTSHETTLMTPEVMRRDQFYFTEKTITDETRLYSLADLKGIRNNADFARQYLAGFYGALPALGNYIEQSNHKE